VLRPALPQPAPNEILIEGAREHNLKNITVRIPRDRFVVVTGVSGSGKSTLAFDLLFAEGQRRFLDAMNTYTRQFVEQLSRPDVDLVAGLPPTVSIEQRNSRGGGKSTVATVTEVYHFLRLLFARLGTQYCPDCQLRVAPQSRDTLSGQLRAEVRRRGQLRLLAPVVRHRKGFHTEVADWAHRHGYSEIRADRRVVASAARLRLDRYREHDIEVVIGRLGRGSRTGGIPGSEQGERILNEALKVGAGTVLALDGSGETTVHSTERACGRCGRSFAELDPKNFSYNSVQGWCPRCRGFGELFYLPDVDRGARADAIEESWFEWQEDRREPCPECQGMRLNATARAVRLESGVSRAGAGRNAGRSASQPGPTIDFFASASVSEAFAFFRKFAPRGRDALIARDLLPEIHERLRFLEEVGLGYLQLGRGVPTLSGGEAQRIRLAAQLGSNLTGVLYILDEPTIGLHARDNAQLLKALALLKSRGNSLVVVEHDEATMRHADHVIDLGPGAGIHGGHVVASGRLAELQRHPHSVTGRCLREKRSFPDRGERREVNPRHEWLVLEGAAANNLKRLRVSIPLRRFVVVTGVSGSGKSTLVRSCLLPALEEQLSRGRGRLASLRRGARSSRPSEPAGPADRGDPEESVLTERSTPWRSGESAATGQPGRGVVTRGIDRIRSVYEVDQSPIGRTPRSIPATYVGFFDEIRQLFAQLPESRLRGYTASRFSFNSAQGRCPECDGAGSVKLEMNFLPPAFVRCEACDGRRFSRETLDLQFAGRNIAEILDLSVEEALGVFAAFPKIRRPLEGLRDTGLGYLRLGQTSPTLSGGEAQRVKLVSHLLAGWKEQMALPNLSEKRNLFLLEEPTIGLHMADVRLLVRVLQRLVDAGHTVVVIEHNLDLIAEADWVIDLGPEGGEAGGQVVAVGTPEAVAKEQGSHTGRYLRGILDR
jgi:excinuclease ABC subunit A